MTELAGKVQTSLPTVVREVHRLVDSGLLTMTSVGRSRQVTVNAQHPLHAPMSQIVLRTFGVAPVLAAALGSLAGIKQSYIYGSWASRLRGINGPPSNDVDVLVIGAVDRLDLHDAATAAGHRLGIEVSARRVNEAVWNDSDDAFLTHVRHQPLFNLFTGRFTDEDQAHDVAEGPRRSLKPGHTADEVHEDLVAIARGMVDAARQLLPQLTVFVPE